MRFLISLLFVLCLSTNGLSAEYKGKNIDNKRYDATVYSYSTSKYYDVEVEFDGDECTIYFSQNSRITVALDDEEIEDPHNISAYDYKRSVYWDIDVEGLD
ncbi:MAG: hypothetical protein FD167_5573 [bacterium]|nr:MAG: hypothetical protein FD167_5573 [bacterium]